MTTTPGAAALLRSVGLVADGPVLWDAPLRSASPGIFMVELAVPHDTAPIDITTVRRWVDRVPGLRLDGERPTPTQLSARLAAFWLPSQRVVYLGRSAKTLSSRVNALRATVLGDRRPHAGGHWLKTLYHQPRLRIWWAETDAPEEYEDALLAAFAEGVAADERDALPDSRVILPWACLESATGERKGTGISGSLLSEEDAARQSARAPAATASPAARGRAASARQAGSARPAGPSRRRTGSTAAPARPAPAVTHLTAAGLAVLEAELRELATRRRPEVIARVKHARELGDLRENADYEAARNEQSFLEGRIKALEQMIRTAELIEADHTGEVIMGATVRCEHAGEEVVFHIVGSTEADPSSGRISAASPVGKALLGRRAGDEVAVRTPGHELRYVIREVS